MRLLSAYNRFLLRPAGLCLLFVLCAASHVAWPQTPKAFEVASIRLVPNHSLEELKEGKGLTSLSPFPSNSFIARNATLDFIVQIAYGIDQNQIVGEPDWMATQAYDISAKAEGDAALTREQMQPLLRHLLEERFHLVLHRETRQFKGYVLVVAKGGPKLIAAKGTQSSGQAYPSGIDAQGFSLSALASILALPLKSHIIDKTGLDGNYDFHLRFAPEGAADSPYPSIFTALQDTYGLKLEPKVIPIEILVIDHIDRTPTEN